jgi:hypothetical protein
MKIKLTILTLLALCPILFGAELSTLKVQYETAIKNATAPINATYEAELRKLLSQYQVSGDSVGAANVTFELNKLLGTSLVPVVPTAPVKPALTGLAKTQLEEKTLKAFGGKEFQIPGAALLTFKRDGTGTKAGGPYVGKGNSVPFLWKVDEDFAVATGSRVPGEPVETTFYRFVDKETIAFGKSKDSLVNTAKIK